MSNKRTLTRAGTLLFLAFAAATAHAVDIGLSSMGTTDFTNFSDFVVQENVLAQDGGFGALTSLRVDINGGTLTGDGIYTGPTDTLDFHLVINSVVSNGNSQSIDGLWTYTGGTGTYANLPGGSGTFAQSLLINHTPAISFFTFTGDLAPVPEPASMAILATGLLGIAAKRRKKA